MEEYLLLQWHWSDDGPPKNGLELADHLGMSVRREIRSDPSAVDFDENENYELCSRPGQTSLEHYLTSLRFKDGKLDHCWNQPQHNVRRERISPGVFKYTVEEKPEVIAAKAKDEERILRANEKFDEERSFEVWIEGHRATGEHATAQCWGSASAHSFREAVDKVVMAKGADPSYLDFDRLSYWACRFFDNAADARQFAG